MVFFKDYNRNKKLQLKIEEMKAKAELIKAKSALSIEKINKKSREFNKMADLAFDVDEVRSALAEKTQLDKFLESPIGLRLTEAVISKFGSSGSTPSQNGLDITALMKKATPSQKIEAMRLVNEINNRGR